MRAVDVLRTLKEMRTYDEPAERWGYRRATSVDTSMDTSCRTLIVREVGAIIEEQRTAPDSIGASVVGFEMGAYSPKRSNSTRIPFRAVRRCR
ncbi:hypothetical protein C487_10907 [Natrinema pallidum DSM 3751]|uniref:Uncharacterized protein n=1 Tax=Natrinema pallidum DSM 3751 TaxID=1227495 RepID=L9YSM9_9EURY|nr:hypothetical protein C487_10907 [Natrinema pallidum DSM 3751]